MSEVAFGCEISEDRAHGAVVAAGRGDGGLIVVDLVWYAHPGGMAGEVARLCGAHDPVSVCLDPRSQSATLVRPLLERGVLVHEVAAREVAVAHGEFLDLVRAGGLRHLGQEPLTAAVRAAQQRSLAGGQAVERRVGVDQSPLTAAEFAVSGFLRWEELSAPGVFVF